MRHESPFERTISLPRIARRGGFTLLELLLTVAILAIVAGGILFYTQGVEADTKERLGQVEVRAVWEAVRGFRRDTGFLPRQGAFALAEDGGKVEMPPEGRDWFLSAANFGQLLEEPRDAAGEPVLSFSPDTGRGWRGPYLARAGEGIVDIGAGLAADGRGSPTTGEVLLDVPGIADPFDAPPFEPYFVWKTAKDAPERARSGRPYLLFDLDDPALARVVGLGPNGTYESQDPSTPGDDLVVWLLR